MLDEYRMVFARIDMGYREYLVGIEFDGAHHWTDSKQRSWDIERLAWLQEHGWIIIRVSAGMLHRTPEVFLARVGDALLARGCPRTGDTAKFDGPAGPKSAVSARGSAVATRPGSDRRGLTSAHQPPRARGGRYAVAGNHLTGHDRRGVAVGGLI